MISENVTGKDLVRSRETRREDEILDIAAYELEKIGSSGLAANEAARNAVTEKAQGCITNLRRIPFEIQKRIHLSLDSIL